MRKLLLLGEAPNALVQGRSRLWLRPDNSGVQHTGNRLLEATGWGADDYLRYFERTNLLYIAQKKTARGSSFDRRKARARAGEVLAFVRDQELDGLIALGKRVTSCFEWARLDDGVPVRRDRLPPFVWHRCSWAGLSAKGVSIPHPSPVNPWWRDEENRMTAKSFFAQLLVELREGSCRTL